MVVKGFSLKVEGPVKWSVRPLVSVVRSGQSTRRDGVHHSLVIVCLSHPHIWGIWTPFPSTGIKILLVKRIFPNTFSHGKKNAPILNHFLTNPHYLMPLLWEYFQKILRFYNYLKHSETTKDNDALQHIWAFTQTSPFSFVMCWMNLIKPCQIYLNCSAWHCAQGVRFCGILAAF